MDLNSKFETPIPIQFEEVDLDAYNDLHDKVNVIEKELHKSGFRLDATVAAQVSCTTLETRKMLDSFGVEQSTQGGEYAIEDPQYLPKPFIAYYDDVAAFEEHMDKIFQPIDDDGDVKAWVDPDTLNPWDDAVDSAANAAFNQKAHSSDASIASAVLSGSAQESL
ncbi:hypothetical protein EUX98_g8616 [Antrodiella citrinella]|uniref:Uncharacterized protein n=1 Tax=Antrodiella citrinella TaxID=2447956 RepID=A0A4S4M792_9APHY|nr:hypothetical protein EUX98_g8616 [Antrodiella citrinella]